MEAIEVVRAKLLISLLALQQMVGDREHGVGYCDERALSAHPRREAPELSGKISFARAACGPCGPAEEAAHRLVFMSSLAALRLPALS
jgi:hypothetical protein